MCSRRKERWGRGMLLLLWLYVCAATAARGAVVDIWLSNSDEGPEAPAVHVLAGSTMDIGVWARPAAGETLLGFSLNLIADAPHVTFTDLVVHNPPLEGGSGAFRHQLTFDADSGLTIQDNSIHRFSGLSLPGSFPDLPDGAGLGPTCQDAMCSTASGDPSWHIVTVTFLAGDAGTSAQLFLEIGEQGVWHADEAPTETSAVFGNDGVEHVWSTGIGETDHRDSHFGLPDLVVYVVGTLSDADFDEDGRVDGFDFLVVQRGFGGPGTHDDGDADGDGQVAAADVAIWQSQFGSLSGSLAAVPEPPSVVMLLLWLVLSSIRASR